MDNWDRIFSALSVLAYIVSVNLVLHERWQWAGVSAAVGFCMLFMTLPEKPDPDDE